MILPVVMDNCSILSLFSPLDGDALHIRISCCTQWPSLLFAQCSLHHVLQQHVHCVLVSKLCYMDPETGIPLCVWCICSGPWV